MAVLKEYTCRKCGHNFEGFVPVCAKCGYESEDNRTWRTAPGINGGHATANSARRLDRIMENELTRQGVSNFSNRGGINKVEYKRLRQKAPGVYATPFGGAQTPPIQAGFVSGGLQNPNLKNQVSFQVDGQSWLPPSDSGGIQVNQPGQKVRGGPPIIDGKPQTLASKTWIAGRTDERGNQIR